MTDLSKLVGLVFGSTNVDESLLAPDTSQLLSDGVAIIPSTSFSSDADGGIRDTFKILSADSTAATPYRLGTIVLQDIGANGFKNPPNTFDVIGVNNGQVLLGLTGDYDPTNPSDAWDGNYTLLSNTNLSQSASLNPYPTTFPIGVSNTDGDGAYMTPHASLTALAGVTFAATNVNENSVSADTSTLLSNGVVNISSTYFSSDADAGIHDTFNVLSVDLSTANAYRLGTVSLQDIGANGFKNPPNTFDIIAVNKGQVLLGLTGDYDPTNPSDAWNGNYTFLSNTNISVGPAPNPNPPTFPIQVATSGIDGAYAPPGTSDLASLIGETFASTNVNENSVSADTSKLLTTGHVPISAQYFSSDADAGIKDSFEVLSVDLDTKTAYRLGTLSLQDIGANGFRNPPNTFDIIAVNGSQVLLGLTGDYDPTNPSDAWNGNYTFISNTNISITPSLNANPPTFPIDVANNGDDGAYMFAPPCFAAGTRIATPSGEVAVEDLREGDVVTLAAGGTSRVIWVGRRRVDCRSHPAPETVRPVRISRGAFADNVPSRDLVVSPDHAILFDGHLIPSKSLENGVTIVQSADTGRICYHHVELERHDALLAEGLAAESYLDTGNRSSFANAPIVAAHAAFGRPGDQDTVIVFEGFAPLVLAGPVVDAARARLAARADLIAGGTDTATRYGIAS